MRFRGVYVVQPYNSNDTVTDFKNSRFILSEIIFSNDRWPANSSSWLSYMYVDITLRRWDIDTEVFEFVN